MGNFKKYFIVVVVSFILTSGISSFASEIKVGAGTTASSSVLTPVKEHFEKAAGVNLTILNYGSKAAMKELDAGNVDAAMGAHTSGELIDMLKKDGYEVKDPTAFQETIIEEPKSYIIVVHNDNPVSKLTSEQAKGLFTGKIENWKDVGGKDAPVIVIWGKLLEASNKHFIDTILDKESVTKDILEVTTMADVKESLASLPDAIGYLPAGMIDASVKSPEAPVSKTKPINIFTKGKPSADVQKLSDYIKGEGQKYIKK
ncbi:MAG: substrate-binding domain-containing protein [Nitrospirae bacterium]|nr:substrate-binding domain-containing protein [Nitrospirota bacterium]